MKILQRVTFIWRSDYWKGSVALIAILLLTVACSSNEKQKAEDEEVSPQQWEAGVALYSFNRFPFAESLDKAEKAGVKYIEGFSFHQLGEGFRKQSIMELSDEQLTRMKTMMEEQGLHMRSLYVGAETKSEWKQFFRVAGALELDFLVGEPAPELWDWLNKVAGEQDMLLAIHQHARGRSRYWHPDSVLAALEGNQNMGACADLGHWVRSGLDPVESLQKLEGHIISVHVKDLDAFGNVEANDVKIGSGVIDYKAVVKELDRQGFSGPVYIEAEHNWEDNLGSVRFGVEYLRGLRGEQAK